MFVSHPIKFKKIIKKRVLPYVKNSIENPPRQSLKKLYIPSGNIYIVKRDSLIKKKSLIGKRQTFYLIKKNHYLNIDSQEDFETAKMKLKKYFQN